MSLSLARSQSLSSTIPEAFVDTISPNENDDNCLTLQSTVSRLDDEDSQDQTAHSSHHSLESSPLQSNENTPLEDTSQSVFSVSSDSDLSQELVSLSQSSESQTNSV